jgi:DNA-binding CsgD family transcriptional regulator/tetratricopeptide (TPR) repeat protein
VPLGLRGRRSETEALDRLLRAVAGGDGRALVLTGENGVGKTALLRYVAEAAPGFQVVRAAGVQSEMELAFAGLHQLCVPLLDRLGRLPDPQAQALGTAFGLRAGDAPDRFLVGLAALSLLAEVAGEQPLLCLVDDAQWLDRASAESLAFVARRLVADSVGLVFALREPSEELKGLPHLTVAGLDDADARALLASVLRGPLDERVRDRIIAETRGNPLALLELPRGLSPVELAGGFGLPDAPPLSGRIEESFQRRLAPLPVATRRLLLVAAAEPVGDATLVWAAARRLGIDAKAAAPAAAVGLLDGGAGVQFRHPLVRSAVYRAASPAERQLAHAALAQATDPASAPDRRAWHRAHATAGPDDDVAAELERSAARAQARGGLAAAAAFLQRATELTVDPARRTLRALVAAQAKLQAGAPDAAADLLDTALSGPADDLQRGRVDLLRAQIAFTSSHAGDAPALLLKAAERLAPLDARLARETYLDALAAAMFAGRMGGGSGVRHVAESARSRPPAPEVPRAPDLLLDGLVAFVTEGIEGGTPLLRRALRAFGDSGLSDEDGIRWLWLAAHAAMNLWDEDAWDALSAQHVRLARDNGAFSVLPIALSARIGIHVFAGDLDTAAALVDEVRALTEAGGGRLAPYGALSLTALQGREPEASKLIEATRREVAAWGGRMGLSVTQQARALLYNGLGRYEDALDAAQHVTERADEMLWSSLVLPELIEAASRSGKTERAVLALERLTDATRASGSDWALGIEARSRALLSDGDTAEGLYREAIQRLGRTRAAAELARSHLLYGEWLRRERRRTDAREELRTAFERFTAMGIEAFGRRAEAELLAAGEPARRRAVETTDGLTAQEAQVARLAREGLSNPEIGSRLFLSPRTVEYHLRKVFIKLGISSRSQLRGGLSSDLGS